MEVEVIMIVRALTGTLSQDVHALSMKPYTKHIIFIAIFLMLLVLGVNFAKRNNGPQTTKKTLRVMTSLYPLYYFASQIAGDKADIKNITPSGAEPHDYDPSAQDVAKIEKSNLLILNGLVEGWGDKIRNNFSGIHIVTAGEGLFTITGDPHVWLDPQDAKKEVKSILEALLKIDPNDRDYFYANTNALLVKLDDLDSAYEKGLSSCEEKDIITSHAAFGYLASHYGLNQVPIAGLSPDAEPSAQQLADVASFAKSHGVSYIFFERLVSPKLSETIASEIGAKTLVLDPIEGVSNDDMKAGKNYLTIMRDNLKNLQIALQCN